MLKTKEEIMTMATKKFLDLIRKHDKVIFAFQTLTIMKKVQRRG